nr:putative reverse transcriptase domain-containing protein [Tanacetum cinerariifolium]
MEFEVGDMVMLKVSPWKGVIHFRKCDKNLVIPLEEIQLDDKLHFIEELVEIIDREIKQRIQAAHDRQKSYTDLKRKPMEFQVGDKVMLKVSPWKGVVRFGKRGKLNPRYVGPFKVIERKYYVNDLSSCVGSELGSELTSLAGSELGSELTSLAGSELSLVLSYDESKSKRVFERAFMTLFGQDNETFTSKMFLYLGQLQNQLGKDEFKEDKSMVAFWVLNNQF